MEKLMQGSVGVGGIKGPAVAVKPDDISEIEKRMNAL